MPILNVIQYVNRGFMDLWLESPKFWNMKHPFDDWPHDSRLELVWRHGTPMNHWISMDATAGRVVWVAGHVAVRNGRRDPNWRNNVGLLIRWLHPDGTWRHVQIDCGKTFRESVMLWYKEHQAGWGWGKIYEIWIMNEKYWKISLDISALKRTTTKTYNYRSYDIWSNHE